MSQAVNWDVFYKRQPVQLDVILLMVALLLHLPLMMVHMRAAQHGKTRSLSKLVNIDYIEEQTKKRKEKPVVIPKMEAPKQLQDIVKKVEQVQQQVFKRSLPPPPVPKPRAEEPTIVKGPEAGKLESNLKDKMAQDKKVLQGKGGFQGRDLKLSGPESKDLKIAAGGAGAIQTGSRLGGAGGPQGPTLRGKSGFQVSGDAAPASIGGGDDLKIAGGGGNIVVVPVGSRAKSDNSILSPVAKRDKGPLMAQGPAIAGGASGGQPSLAGAGGATTIQAGGGSRAPISPAPAAVRESKKLEDKSLPNPLTERAAPAASPVLTPLPRRIAPRVEKPMFLITGPLANRKVLSRDVPEYPEWAREKGVESSVVLQFTVTPEGAVKDNVIVIRTSGYPQLDQLATDSLLKWKFITLPVDQYRDEVGTITFNFSVR